LKSWAHYTAERNIVDSKIDLASAENRLGKLGFKFKRQVLIGASIVDFVCLEKRLDLHVPVQVLSVHHDNSLMYVT
jgi:very-short-patch-repair endonuclease